ncbi:helix-turn-helix domain-containing protein [Paucilactobacillus hokkaidonensis]|uniref:helix-turn-helix domain-containing protein n=1 Tax=Paucilactobacillus hokkaidonensis TaxID=1193095 RepID=UPI000A89AB87|nr:helix-turn-helix domain-containing protein [Paucilactobacillus hokkaidonensis]
MPIWREQIRTKRKQLNITQTTLARRIGITVRHVQRLENGTRSPSSSLQMQIDYVLAHWGEDPELTLNFDYVRIRFPTHDVETLIEKVLNLKMDFMLFNDWGLYGYSTSYVFSNIQVMASTPTEKNWYTIRT